MGLFSMRNMLGAAAIYGGWKYAQKHGGVKQSLEGLLEKVREAAEQKRGREIGEAGRGRERMRGAEVSPGLGASELGPDVGSELGSSVSSPTGASVQPADLGISSGGFGTESAGSTRPRR